MTSPQKRRSSKASPNGDPETDFTRAPLKDKIGLSLKRMYDDVVNEPIPDDFLSLLAQADETAN